MFNLLPEAEKKAVKREYRFRFYAIIIWFAACSFAFLFILLLPSYLLSKEKKGAAERSYESIQQSLEIKDGKALEEIAKHTNWQLDILKEIGDSKTFQELVKEIIQKKTGNISTSNFTMRTVEVKNVTYRELFIKGVAANRASLVAFSKMLDEFEELSKVELPVSNFTEDTNIEFSIKAEGKF